MEEFNISNLSRIIGTDKKCKVHKLLEFAASTKDIADPWYTGDFETAYREITEGCRALLNLVNQNKDF